MTAALTVSQLVYEIKVLLEDSYREVRCIGEISNFSSSASGHFYFNLSDENAAISCAVFKMDALRNPIVRSLKNGDKIQVMGPISLYVKRGSFQIIVKQLSKVGQGTLLEKYKQLKDKLNREGLFDIAAKKAIPAYPKRLALITGDKSAALEDFITVFERRAFMGEVIVITALVQGDKSEASLLKALGAAQKLADLDLIVISRGGGSMEDLWSFNSEALARAIYNTKVPVISAIGHEVDITLCDYVSDLRVETPTAAAEKITERQLEVLEKMDRLHKGLKLNMDRNLSAAKQRLLSVAPLKNISRVATKLNRWQGQLRDLGSAMANSRALRIQDKLYAIDQNLQRIEYHMKDRFKERSTQLANHRSRLEALNPKKVLSRGYSLVRQEGKLITKKSHLKSDRDLNIEFSDGRIEIKKG